MLTFLQLIDSWSGRKDKMDYPHGEEIELIRSRRFRKRLAKLSKKRQDVVAKTLH